jgi:hypothetical protein
MSGQTVFNAAVPYALTTIAVGAVGAGLIFTAQTTAAVVMGVVLGVLSTYALIGIFIGGLAAENADAFKRDIGKILLTSAGVAIQSVIKAIVDAAIAGLQQGISQRVSGMFNPRR